MLQKEKVVFVLVDVQGKLLDMVYESQSVQTELIKLMKGMHLLEIPFIWLEQYPEGLGRTSQRIAKHLPDGMRPISKITFNACENEAFSQELAKIGAKQVVIAGIEAHICVYQTAVGLTERGYEVEVVQDAVSSRTKGNKQIGLKKMKSYGVRPTSVEMVLYELMKSANTDIFKEILSIIK